MNELALAGGPVRPIERTSRPSGGPIDFDLLRRKSWPGISAECVRLTAPIAYDFRLKIPANFLMHLNLHRSDGETVLMLAARTGKEREMHSAELKDAPSARFRTSATGAIYGT